MKNKWRNSNFVLHVIKSLCLADFALIINFYSVRIADYNQTNSVGDLFFTLFPKINTSIIDAHSISLVSLVTIIVILLNTNFTIKILNYTSIIILLRSLFINLTHLGVPENIIANKNFFTQGGDLFFSGHVAIPFMIALVVWDVKYLRYLYLLIAILMAAQVLLGRYHYSIDVAAAFFITYATYTICEKYTK